MPDVHPRRDDDARLVEASRAGDPAAFPALFEHWFDPCVDVAWRIVHDRDAAADVAQETFLAAWRGLDTLRDPGAFGGWVLRTARNRALDRLERDRRSVALGEDHVSAALDGRAGPVGGTAAGAADEPGAAAERDENAALVWAASAALGERDASVLDLHLRHGLAVPEIAEALGVTPNNANQLLFRLRKRLSGAIRAWVLWRDGDPACADLRVAFAAAGVARFGADAVRVASRHVPDCEDCDGRQQLRLAPDALFAAIPIVPAGSVLRARTAAALQAEGVPVSPTPTTGPPADAGPAADGGASGPDGGPPADTDPPTTDTTPSPDAAPPADTDLAADLSPTGEAAVGPGDGAPEADDYESPGNGGVSRWLVAAGVAAIVLVVGLVALLAGRSTGDGSVDTAGSSRRDEPTTTETTDPPPTTAPTTTTVAPQTTGTAAPGSSSTGSTGTTASGPTADPSPVDPPPGGDPTTEDPPPPAAPAPEIVRFAATETAAGAACARGERTVSLVWTTEEATSATLAGPGAPTGDQPATGRATACAPPGQATYTLTATGPGGTAESTATSGTPPAG